MNVQNLHENQDLAKKSSPEVDTGADLDGGVPQAARLVDLRSELRIVQEGTLW